MARMLQDYVGWGFSPRLSKSAGPGFGKARSLPKTLPESSGS